MSRSGNGNNAKKTQLASQQLHILPEKLSADIRNGRSNADSRVSSCKASFHKLGQPIAGLDLKIAAIVLAAPAVLATDNLKHFERIPELRLENWK